LEQYGMTQEQLSERVGKNRATVTNYLRLLKLPAPIQMGLKNREIEMGHARALLALDDPEAQIKLFSEIKKEKMSVRKIEEMAKELSEGGTVRSGGQRIRQKGSTLNAEYNVLKDSLSKFFQTKVQLTCSDKGKGKITIPFSNEQELERIIELFDQLNH
jgi:ParB family chromosome partitioning protein